METPPLRHYHHQYLRGEVKCTTNTITATTTTLVVIVVVVLDTYWTYLPSFIISVFRQEPVILSLVFKICLLFDGTHFRFFCLLNGPAADATDAPQS